jgi:hypothetical protein
VEEHHIAAAGLDHVDKEVETIALGSAATRLLSL